MSAPLGDRTQTSESSEQQEKNGVSGFLGWAFWAGVVIFFGQSAWASLYENEIRAAIIYAAFAGLLILGGMIVYLSRRYNAF